MPKRTWSLDGGLAFRDSVIAADPRKSASRLALDDERLLGLARHVDGRPGPTGSLKAACADILARELLFGHLPSADSASSAAQSQEENALSMLWDERTSLPRLPDPLALAVLEAVIARLPEDDRALPMGLWSAADAYTGLVLSDSRELSHLASLGSTRGDWHGFPRFSTLTILDLAFAAWTDDDMHSLRLTVGHNLVWLNLSGTSVTDAGVAHLVRGLHYEDEDGPEPSGSASERFCRVQALILRFLPKVTDKGMPKLARLPSLRLVDIRETSCTTSARYLLTSGLSGPGALPTKVDNRFVTASEAEEKCLLSERVSVAHRLDLLRDLCGTSGTSDFATSKSLRVYIEDKDRAPPFGGQGAAGAPEGDGVAEPTRARSSAHGAIYATVKVSHETLLEDSDKARGSAAFFAVASHAKARSDAPFTSRGPWNRAAHDRARGKKRDLVVRAEKEGEEPDHGMILRREPLPARPELRPATVPSSNGVDAPSTNPVKRKLLANAPGDRQHLKVRRTDNKSLDKDLFGSSRSAQRPSTGTPVSTVASRAATPLQDDRPRGRLQAALEKDTARPISRAKLSAFRRPS